MVQFTPEEMDEILFLVNHAWHENVDWAGKAWNDELKEIHQSILDKIRGTE